MKFYQHCEVREVNAKGFSGFFPCLVENCTCWFTNRSGLNQHLKREHGVKELVC